MTNEQLKIQADLNIEKCVNDIFKKENIVSYFDVVSRFPHLGYKNQILLWRQKPNAICVAGREAIEAKGIKLTGNEQKILLLYPSFILVKEGKSATKDGVAVFDYSGDNNRVVYEINPEYVADYKAVVAYDIGECEGYEPDEFDKSNVFNNIKSVTGNPIVEGSDEDFKGQPDEYRYGFYVSDEDSRKRRFVIRKGLNEAQQTKALVSAYIDCLFSEQENNEYVDLVKRITKCVAWKFFDVFTDDVSLLFISKVNKTNKREDGEEMTEKEIMQYKMDILHDVSQMFFRTVCDLSFSYLSFNEVSIANHLIHTNSLSSLHYTFWTVKENICDQQLIDEIDAFCDQLYFCEEGYLEQLYEMVKNGKLFTYPKVPLVLCDMQNCQQ